MSDFLRALAITLELEGKDKLSLNPKDPGNWTGGKQGVGELKGTKYGIAASAHPHLDIPNLTLEQASAIYQKQYWYAAECEKQPWPMCAAMFDFAVQSGPARAKRYLVQFPDLTKYMDARNAFLNRWADKNPGNAGVRTRVGLLKGKLGIK